MHGVLIPSLLLIWFVSGSTDAGGPLASSADVRTIVVSGRRPGLSEVDARAEAQREIEQKLAVALSQLAKEWAGVYLSATKVRSEWLWLAQHPDVRKEMEGSCELKEYGWVAEYKLTVSLPPSVLRAWVERLNEAAARTLQRRLYGGIGTLLLLGVAMLTMLMLDRWTRGYYRPLVVGGVSVATGIILLTLWMWILFVD